MVQVASRKGKDLTPVILFREVIVKYGIEESLVLDNFAFWCCRNEVTGVNLHDGRYWTHNTQSHLSSTFGLSHRQFRRIIDNLVKAGVLLVGNYNNTKYDRTIWYAVDFDKLASDGFPSIREKTIFKVKEHLGIPQDVDINKPIEAPIYSAPKTESPSQPIEVPTPQTAVAEPNLVEYIAREILKEYPKYCQLKNGNTPFYRRNFAEVGGEVISNLQLNEITDDCETVINVLKNSEQYIMSNWVTPADFVIGYFNFKADYERNMPKLRIADINKRYYEELPEYDFVKMYKENASNFEDFFGISRSDAYTYFISKGIEKPPVEYYDTHNPNWV